jgi:hypothetical protein
MQDLDIRYAFILLPIVYSMMPFFLTGNFLLLGTISVSVFIIGAVLFVLIFSLNFGGSGTVVASGVSGKLGLNQEGTYMLFILVFGGLFYGVSTFLVLFLNDLIGFFNFIIDAINFVSFGVGNLQHIDIHGASLSVGSYTITSPSSVYPTDLTFMGISVFTSLSVFMGLIYILGIFFLVSSRGK